MLDAPATWNDAALNSLRAIESLILKSHETSASLIRRELDGFIESLYDRKNGHERAIAFFSCIGADAFSVSRNRGISLTVADVHRVLVRKQRDYGPENIRRFGRQGLMIRLHDKVARLENLDGGGRAPENESVVDTFLDIIGYCTIGIMWERGEFLLPLK